MAEFNLNNVVKNPSYDPNSTSSNFYIPGAMAQSTSSMLNPVDSKLEQLTGKTTLSDRLKRTASAAFSPAGTALTAFNPVLGTLYNTYQAGRAALGGTNRTTTPQTTQPEQQAATRTEPGQTGGDVAPTAPNTATSTGRTSAISQNVPTGSPTDVPTYDPSVTGEAIDVNRLAPNELADLATRAGQAGLGLGDYIDLVNANAGMTAADSGQIRENLGIGAAEDAVFTAPQESMEDLYRKLYRNSGLVDLKKDIAAIDDRINQKRDDFNKVEGDIKNNPWLSSASRRGRLKNAAELALNDIANDINERQQYLDLYDKGVSQIETQLGYAIEDRNLQRGIDTERLNYLLNEAERLEGLEVQERTMQGLRNVPLFIQGARDEQLRQEAVEAARASAANAVQQGVWNGSGLLVDQPAYQNLGTTAQARADSLNNLVRSMNDLRTYYDTNPGVLGGAAGNMFGQDSATLEGLIAGVTFAAAQAEGTGALQEADRKVIQEMIPNPTNLGGAVNTVFKGGKQGNLDKIDTQINKFSENLRQLGITPVVSSQFIGASGGQQATAGGGIQPSAADISYVSTLNLNR